MIAGTLSESLEPRICLHVSDAGGHLRQVNAIVDTGFNGFLTLAPWTIAELNLTWRGRDEAELGDGSVVSLDVYIGRVEWDGMMREVEIECADADPLVGMAMLEGHRVVLNVRADGEITIAPLT
jgi:clan AA aspartic protease